jgi:alkylated DNA repair dioxygenase AlkB
VWPEGFTYVADLLDEREHAELLRFLQSVRYDEQNGPPGMAVWRSVERGNWRSLTPGVAATSCLDAVLDRAEPHCPAGPRFNQVAALRYPRGFGMRWHTDAMRFGPVIVGVNLGADARLRFRPKGAVAMTSEVLLRPGSMYVLAGPARFDFHHSIAPVNDERYSFTFRKVEDAVATQPGAQA